MIRTSVVLYLSYSSTLYVWISGCPYLLTLKSSQQKNGCKFFTVVICSEMNVKTRMSNHFPSGQNEKGANKTMSWWYLRQSLTFSSFKQFSIAHFSKKTVLSIDPNKSLLSFFFSWKYRHVSNYPNCFLPLFKLERQHDETNWRDSTMRPTGETTRWDQLRVKELVPAERTRPVHHET